jgi:hypothetical protein
MAFGLLTGFIEHLKIVTTSKCTVSTNLHFYYLQRLHHVCATLNKSLLCTHSNTCTQGVVLNYINTGTTYIYMHNNRFYIDREITK